MKKRYGALRFISVFYKVVGVIIAILTLLSALTICGTSVFGSGLFSTFGQDLQNSGIPIALTGAGVVAGIIGALTTIVAGALAALGVYAFGELISLFINIEENTRLSANLASHRPQPVQPVQPTQPVPPVEIVQP